MPSNEYSDDFLKKNILLVRHGRTDWNDAHRFQGRTDVPLNAAGRVQAEKVAARLAGWSVDVIYTSPMTRARETAAAIAAPHGKSPVVLDDLTEVNFGSWEGLFLEQVREQNEERFQEWLLNPFFCMPERAETWDTIRARAERLKETVLRSSYQRVIMVSHGGTIRALFAVLLGFDPRTVWNVKTFNCALSGIEVRKNQSFLAFSNDVLHLDKNLEGIPLPVW
ncbi:MAG: histidine phosphatase family protein [Synergistaceae bacterium]|nr:histidine phosphatase family protein [Synergistaceae bacterium]